MVKYICKKCGIFESYLTLEPQKDIVTTCKNCVSLWEKLKLLITGSLKNKKTKQ